MNVRLVTVAAVLLLFMPASASAATVKWYWTEGQAEATAVKKVRIPWCRVEPSDPKCADPATRARQCCAYPPRTIACTGKDEKGASFTYPRFSCRLTVGYQSTQSGREVLLGAGTIAVYVTGATSMRWAVLSWASR